MKFERRQRFPIAASELVALLTDRQYYARRYRMSDQAVAGEAQDNKAGTRFECWEETAEGLHVRIVKSVPIKADKLPAMVRSFVSSEMPFYSDFVWRGLGERARPEQADADCKFWLGHAPAHIEGEIHISGQGNECEQYFSLRLVSKIPMLSRKLKDKAVTRVEKLLEADFQALLRYIEAHYPTVDSDTEA